MMIEPLEPLKIRLPGGEVRQLVPGELIELPDESARKLLALAPSKVRLARLHLNSLLPGVLLWWRSMDGETRGPAVLLGTFGDKGQIWAWFTLEGIEYLIRTDLIVKVQRPEDE